MIFVDCDDCLYQNEWKTAKRITESIGAYTAKQAAAESVKGLSDLLSSIYLGNQIEAARSWCASMPQV